MRKQDHFPEDPYNDLNFLFWQIFKSWQREKQKVLSEFGITGSQLEVLSAVYYLSSHQESLASFEEEEVTQIAISKSINVDPMTTSTVLRNLEKKGLVQRNLSKIDTRARVVDVTPQGEELLHKAVKTVDAFSDNILNRLDGNALKEELRNLLKILTELNN